MRLLSLIAAGGVFFLPHPQVLAQSVTQGAQRQCRTVPISDHGQARVQTLCKDEDGQWRAPKVQAVNGGSLPPSFRGTITYEGSMHGAWNLKRGDIPYAGTGNFTLTYDGNIVTGNLQVVQDGQKVFNVLSGTREGNTCRLFNKVGIPFEGPCTATGLRFKSGRDTTRKPFHEVYEASAIKLVDAVEEERRVAEANAKAAAEAAENRRQELAQRAEMKARLPKGAVARYTPMLERAVSADAAYWAMNRYAPGSIDLVMSRNDRQSGAIFLKAYFRYAGGNEGWVGAIVKGATIECLTFWDEADVCRGIGQGRGRSIMQGMMESMMSGPSSSSQNSNAEAMETADIIRNTARQTCGRDTC